MPKLNKPDDLQNRFLTKLLTMKNELFENSQIEIINNTQALIQGTKGISEYSQELIQVSLTNMEVKFYGENLSIVCLSQDSLEIKGIINKIEYSKV